jgi:hypothetical protein
VGDADAPARLSRMAARTIDRLLGTDPPAGPIHALDAAPLADDLPWTLREGDARALGASLHWVVKKIEKMKTPPRGELLEALARMRTKPFVSMELHDLHGKATRFDATLQGHLAGLTDQLRLATTLARAGFYPAAGAATPTETLSIWGFDVPTTLTAANAGGEE